MRHIIAALALLAFLPTGPALAETLTCSESACTFTRSVAGDSSTLFVGQCESGIPKVTCPDESNDDLYCSLQPPNRCTCSNLTDAATTAEIDIRC